MRDKNILIKENNKGISKTLLQKLIILGIFILIIIFFSIWSDKFFNLTNFQNITRQVTMVVITGCGVTLLMISGNFDLSVGSTLALTGVLVAKFASQGLPMSISVLFAVLIGGFIGLVNGTLIVNLKIPSIIATLGMLYVARGFAYIISNGTSIHMGLPKNFETLGHAFIGPFPLPLIITVVILLIFYFIESKTILGRYSFAIGGNRTTSLLSGINVGSITILLYIIVGLLAGFSGVMLASRLGAGDGNVGVGFEFDVIVAVLLGGTSLFGGEGSVIGMLIGAFIVGVLGNGLNLIGVHSFYQNIVKGVVLVAAVLLDRTLKSKIKI